MENVGLISSFFGSTLAISCLWFPLCLCSKVLNCFGVRPPNEAKGVKQILDLTFAKCHITITHITMTMFTTNMEHEFPNNFKQFCHRALKWDIDVVSGFTVGEGGQQTLTPSALPHYFPDSGDLDAIYCTPLNYLHVCGRGGGGFVSPLIKEWWTSVCSHLPGPWTKFLNFAASADDLTHCLIPPDGEEDSSEMVI